MKTSIDTEILAREFTNHLQEAYTTLASKVEQIPYPNKAQALEITKTLNQLAEWLSIREAWRTNATQWWITKEKVG